MELFLSPKDVLSKTKDIISINGNTSFSSRIFGMPYGYNYKFKMLIHFKGDKIRCEITPVGLSVDGGATGSSFVYMFKKGKARKIYSDIYNKLNAITNNLVLMLHYSNEDDSLDW